MKQTDYRPDLDAIRDDIVHLAHMDCADCQGRGTYWTGDESVICYCVIVELHKALHIWHGLYQEEYQSHVETV